MHIPCRDHECLYLSERLISAIDTSRTPLADIVHNPDLSTELLTSKLINDIRPDEQGRLVYSPRDKLTRVTATPGKALRKIIVPTAFAPDGKTRHTLFLPYTTISTIIDSDIEIISNILKAVAIVNDPFIVTGEAIRHFYDGTNYTRYEWGTLHSSCMRYSSNWNQIRWYARQPRIIGLLCITDDRGELRGRALLWNTPRGIAMDRCYGTDAVRVRLRAFARQQHWMLRGDDGADCEDFINTLGQECTQHVWVPLQYINPTGEIPFLDSLRCQTYFDDWGLMEDERRGATHTAVCGIASPRGTLASTLRCHWSTTGAPDHIRHDRLDKATDFPAIPPWPTRLMRTDPSWVLGDHPERDDVNDNAIPARRTHALAIEQGNMIRAHDTKTHTTTNLTDFVIHLNALYADPTHPQPIGNTHDDWE